MANDSRIVRNFLFLDPKKKRLFLEALFYLGLGRILISVPFSKVAPTLGTPMKETMKEDTKGDVPVLNSISDALHIISRRTPWESKCLVRAIAASKMLSRRKIPSTLYLGTAKDKSGKLIAHAWLRSGTRIITGADVMSDFSVVAKFANENRGENHVKRSGIG
ncbi:lasso peptide biosynthesis B2 protein [Fictibacillus fluitans]|uniref:Lasso peptide biosynthesis B2 protein n=1 Tax=Fictibacillus fluitans TaxID=3058422 RepID=A0ABT8I2M8_9BACL|nr:lasso peptide biosynthesis B2 protein [Fictibacillus sp. NE201]MDN4526742.1 lasso peptide biosynthesis B2 protein [Fictibacillus sp. NE201]